MNVHDPDGTVRRIREITLSPENNWKYTWTNLPKFTLDPETMSESDIPVQYGVSEGYVPGYTHSITVLINGTYTEETWAESTSFKNGDTYLLKTASGYLATTGEGQNTLTFITDEAAAKESPLALWTATVSSGKVKLTNQKGQSLNYYSSGNTRYFNATTGTSTNQNLIATESGDGFIMSFKSGNRTYYLSSLNKNNYAEAKTDTKTTIVLQPMIKTVTSTTVNIDGYGFKVTNTPLTTETALKVTKKWDHPTNDASAYERLKVTVKLLSNGVDTSRTETLDLQSDWTAVFHGLPYLDENGEPFVYTVVETSEYRDWIPIYGEIKAVGGQIPTYEMTITNRYRWIDAFELPATGGIGYPLVVLCGLSLVAAPLVYGLRMRRRYRKGAST